MPKKIHNSEIDWFVNCSAAALGGVSNLGAQIAALERGGSKPSSSSPDWRGDMLQVKRARELGQVWYALPGARVRSILLAHYAGTLPEQLWPAGTKGGSNQRWPTGVVGQLEDPPGVALFLAHEAGEVVQLVDACSKHDAASGALVRKWNEASLEAQALAHGIWTHTRATLSPRASATREACKW